MSTYTTSGLYIELIGTGEATGTWGASTNNNFQYVFEEAIIGRATVAFTDADVTLTPVSSTTNQTFRNLYLNCTGTNTATRSLIVPSIYKNYIIENNLSSATSILVKTSAGTGITVPNGYKCAVYVDSTNVVQASNYFPVETVGTLTLTNALTTANGGTGLNSFTAGDLPYYASGTTLSKLGIGTNGYVLTSTGSAPTWTATSSLSVANLIGGSTGSVVYQSNVNTTAFLNIASANYVLTVNSGGTAPQWSSSLNVPSDSIFASTGALTISQGTTAQRPVTPTSAMLRFNTSTTTFEGYNGSAWGGIGGAAADNCINTNFTTISNNYTFNAGYCGESVGPITIASGVSVTVPADSRWVIL